MHIYGQKRLPRPNLNRRWIQQSFSIIGYVTLTGLLVLLPFGLKVKGEKGRGDTMTYNTLTNDEARVIIDKGTEAPFSGALLENKEEGVYKCAACEVKLFGSDSHYD